MNSRWSEDLRSRMAEYEAPAPEALFEQVMEALPAAEPAPVVPLVGWRRWTAVAAVVAVMAGGYLLLDRSVQPDADMLTQSIAQSEQAMVEEFIAQSQSEVKPAEQVAENIVKKSLVIRGIPAQAPILVSENQAVEEVAQNENTIPEKANEAEINEANNTENNAENKAENQPAKSKSAAQSRETSARTSMSNLYAVSQPSKRNSARLTANIFASGSAADYSKHGEQQVFQINSVLFGEGDMTAASNGVLLMSSKERYKSDTHHSQPVRVGFSLRYQFSDSWAVESGLTYSMLHSRTKAGHTNNYSTDKQMLSYLGLPVSGVYNIWPTKHFVLYLSAGAMIEKCIAGSVKTIYTINGQNEKMQRTNLMVDELQFSVMGSVGAQVNLSPIVGLYVEPGVGYWFNNGSAIETIYSQQPLNFNLNIGLRFTLR